MEGAIAFYIVPVREAAELALIRGLFQQYWDSFGFTPCFQNFAAELAGLPGRYAPPDGRLALAVAGRDAAGCIALRRLDEMRCEVKRLYVAPAFRGCGVARRLIEWTKAEARVAGYREMLGDTMPVMTDALALYDRMGFERIPPYSDQQESGAIAIRLRL